MNNYTFYVYILASKKNGVVYTGITNNLIRRIYEHKHNLNKSFTQSYFVKRLVYFEEYNYIDEVIAREKCIKRWKREWKDKLINETNPYWRDIYYDIEGKEFEEEMKKL